LIWTHVEGTLTSLVLNPIIIYRPKYILGLTSLIFGTRRKIYLIKVIGISSRASQMKTLKAEEKNRNLLYAAVPNISATYKL
jgi:hypothetical protein